MTLDIPDDLSEELSRKLGNPVEAALEALAAEAYERDVLSLEQVRRLLRLPSRWEAQDVLERHGVWPGGTVGGFAADLATLATIRKPG